MDQLPRLGKRELICLLLFTCNYVVSVWRGFLFLWVLGMGYVILLWHSLSLHIIILQRSIIPTFYQSWGLNKCLMYPLLLNLLIIETFLGTLFHEISLHMVRISIKTCAFFDYLLSFLGFYISFFTIIKMKRNDLFHDHKNNENKNQLNLISHSQKQQK